MPNVVVRLLSGRTPEQKRACGTAIAKALAEHCGARFEAVSVTFEDVSAENWIIDGQSAADRHAAARKS